MKSRHGKFILDLEKTAVEDEHGNRYTDADSWERLQADVEASDMGFRGERDSIFTRIMAARRARATDPAQNAGSDGIPDPVVRHFDLDPKGEGLFHYPLPADAEQLEEPIELFFESTGGVWGVFHDGRRLATYERFLTAAYATEQLAGDLERLANSDTAELPE